MTVLINPISGIHHGTYRGVAGRNIPSMD